MHVGQHHELSAKHLVLALQLLDLKLEVDRLLLEDLDECLVARDGANGAQEQTVRRHIINLLFLHFFLLEE